MGLQTYIRVDPTGKVNWRTQVEGGFEVTILNPGTLEPEMRMTVPTAVINMLAPDYAAAWREAERLRGNGRLTDAEKGKLIFDAAYTGP